MTGWLSQTEVITVSLLWWSTDHNVSLIHFLSNRQPWMDLYSRNPVRSIFSLPPTWFREYSTIGANSRLWKILHPSLVSTLSFSFSIFCEVVFVFCICIVNFVFGLDLHWFLPTINPWEEEAITQAANHSTKPSKAPSIASFGKVHRL